MRPLGQHFLKNHATIERMLDALALKKDDVVIEIGAGHGELTQPLAQKMLSADAKHVLIAIEKDRRLFEVLEAEKLPATLIHNDVLAVLHRIVPTSGPYKLIGNLPYYVTGRFLRIVGELDHKPELCIFMLQKEVAERIVALPPKMNRLAASVQFWSDPAILCTVQKQYFSPPPAVDSAIIVLKTRYGPLPASPDRYYKAVRRIFSQPRKTILNNLLAKRFERKYAEKTAVSRRLQSLLIDPNDRPQNLSVASIAAVGEAFF